MNKHILGCLHLIPFIVVSCGDSRDYTGSITQVPMALQGQKNIPAHIQALAPKAMKSNEVLIHYLERYLPTSNKELLLLTVYNTVSKNTHKLALDEAGNAVSYDKLIEDERSAYYQKYGVLSKSLHDKLQIGSMLKTKHEVEVSYVFSNEIPEKPIHYHTSALKLFKTLLGAAIENTGNSLEATIHANGGNVTHRSKYRPILRATVNGNTLKNILAKDPRIEHIREVVKEEIVPLSVDSTFDLFLITTFHGDGYKGWGVKVGLAGEEGNNNVKGCTIHSGHSWLNFGNVTHSHTLRTCNTDSDCNCNKTVPNVCDTPNCTGRCYNGTCAVPHGTKVAGMIGNSSGIYNRGAPSVSIYMTNGLDARDDENEWFFDNDVFVVNQSFAGYADQNSQDYYSVIGVAFMEAAGNDGANAISSCPASNTICVGGYKTLTALYNNTSTSNWATSDREVPHVTFHGEDCYTTTNDPSILFYGNQRGTSYAAPAAASLVALMYHRWPDTFLGWPEAVRATLMASANRDVHVPPHTSQCPTNGKTFSDYHCPDERDGAGVPNGLRIRQMVWNNRVKKGNLYKDTSFDSNDEVVLATTWLGAGKKIRAVLSFDACPTQNNPNVTNADLDLHLIDDQTGTLLEWGSSYDGTYEILEYTATSGTTVNLAVKKYNWTYCSWLPDRTFYGLAWDIT